ncbi:TATA box-binding protein-associated factor RNA polymerase I subunit B isoform X2 [Electrophorus electricus]|uniref:TATA box-binding protein-associated factor RNA polymerase I subunit B n=1 Tax=Electrophorus electricus TaxID=8005 RepID=A0A4W4FAB3_ELEEL|nr:TATA box-binding protein-associated factor RNA polymerase I subunit B isoform X2 [Electrophorus electricus]
MDEDLTEGYSEPCGQCGNVCWGLTDAEQFFCKNCHNVIERTKDVVDSSTYSANNRISHFPSGTRKRNGRGGRKWIVCEGFQFILKHQAEALVGLGVCPEFKKKVLWNFWMRYLQKTRQAYTKNPRITNGSPGDITSDSEPESLALNESSEASLPNRVSSALEDSGNTSDGKLSVCSGSLDAAYYSFAKESKSRHLMTMPRTLALCHLALLWMREAITLADLLRLVSKRHVPYINVHEHFPEEMKIFGKDCKFFIAESIPSYRMVHREASLLAKVMELPTFPPVSQDCLLHPALLCLRYTMDANLPDELHLLVCKVMEKTAMGNDFFLTFDPAGPKQRLPCYDLQAAALIIVTMKLLFKLDDQTEWMLSRKADKRREKHHMKKKTTTGSKMFSLRRWYMSVQPALESAREREEQAEARQAWKSKKPVVPNLKNKTLVLKRRRVVEQLQSNFHTLTGSTMEQQPPAPSSFLFLWGTEEGADGPSLHHKRLAFLMEKKGRARCLVNRKYWHPALRLCHPRECREHFLELESSLPRMYVWLLGLFSFLLGVSQAQLHGEVIQVERRLLRGKGMR